MLEMSCSLTIPFSFAYSKQTQERLNLPKHAYGSMWTTCFGVHNTNLKMYFIYYCNLLPLSNILVRIT